MSIINKLKAVADIITPPSGYKTLFFRDDTGVPAVKDDAGNVSDLVIPGDASGVTYTPSDPLNWTDSVDPGQVDDALDDLALRVVTLESAPPGSGDALTSQPLSQFAATTSAQLASVMSDETGSGALVFGTSPTLVTPALGTPSALVLTNATGLPVAGGGTGVATLTAYAPIFGGTTGTGAVQSGTAGTAGYVLTSGGAGVLPTFQRRGAVVQAVNTQTGAVATGTTVLPVDDTIPQNSEGDEYMTLAITPTSATNKLKVEVVFFGACGTASRAIAVALFQDTTADALAAVQQFMATASGGMVIGFTHYMTAGTTSATTFKVRAGPNAAGTVTFNGGAAARNFGGVAASSITITEIVP